MMGGFPQEKMKDIAHPLLEQHSVLNGVYYNLFILLLCPINRLRKKDLRIRKNLPFKIKTDLKIFFLTLKKKRKKKIKKKTQTKSILKNEQYKYFLR